MTNFLYEAIISESNSWDIPPLVTLFTKSDTKKIKRDDCIVECVVEDCLDYTKNLKEQGYNPVCLIASSANEPGGGWARQHTKPAQEETIYYRSNIWMSTGGGGDPASGSENWPLGNDVAYSGGVTVFKDTKFDNCTPFKTAFISACIPRPDLDYKGKKKANPEEIIKTILNKIFICALDYGHDAIVLVPIGSGAYNNNPSEIAFHFEKCVKRYVKCFRRISFAVHERDSENYQVYNKYFGGESEESEGSTSEIEECSFEHFESKKNLGKRGRSHRGALTFE